MTVLRTLIRRLLDGFWFVPGAVALGYVLLALALVRTDRALAGRSSVGFEGDAAAAAGILTTIAGSLITVAGLAFSLTIVVLTLVSSQFTPRAIPGLLADRMNQVIAGSFVGLFAYCLLVLRSVRTEPEFVPELSVSVAIVLSLVALAALLLFIHHTAHSIQVSQIAARVGRATLATIERLYDDPYRGGTAEDGDALVRVWRQERAPQRIAPKRAGYVQLVAVEELAALIADPGGRLHVPVRPGDFVTPADTLVCVWTPDTLAEEGIESARRAIPIANERHLADDPDYGLRQLADMAVKALSPGINDPTTAETCIGHLRACLERLAGRAIPPDVLRLRDGGVTAVVRRRGFDDHLDGALAEIGHYAADNTRVLVLVLDSLEAVARSARRAGAAGRLVAVRELSDAIVEHALGQRRADRERALVCAARDRVHTICGVPLDGVAST